MKLIELTTNEFQEFTINHPNTSFYQTFQYARFMEENGFEYNLIGLKDAYDRIIAASVILFKKINDKYFYGYAPKGFLINYDDPSLVKDFSIALSKYYKSKKVIFIKINPNIYISKYDKENNRYIYNDNTKYIDYLKKNNFQELKRNKYFESILPSYSPIIDLSTYSYRLLDKNVRNKIRKCYRKGLSIEKSDYYHLNELYPLIKNKTKKSIKYYDNLFRSFQNAKMIDIFLVKVNFEEYLINTKDKYEKCLKINQLLNEKIKLDKTTKTMKQKIQSDIELDALKQEIVKSTQGLAREKTKVIAGAITIKYKDKVDIFVSGYNKKFKELNVNDYLYYKLIEYYKHNYNYLDLNGFSGDTNNTNPYLGLNNFKIGFNPMVLESLGEFDIVFNKRLYSKLSSNGTLTKVFNNLK